MKRGVRLINRRFLILGLIAILLGIAGLICLGYTSWGGWGLMSPRGMMGSRDMMGSSRMQEMMNIMMRDYGKSSYKSNGERIFLTGQNDKGETISNSMMPSGGHMGQMMRMGCANCHKASGKGGLLFPDGKTKSANITWERLQDHDPPYTENSLKKAITKGIEPDGEKLSNFMPRWEMSQDDLDDLIKYLKSL